VPNAQVAVYSVNRVSKRAIWFRLDSELCCNLCRLHCQQQLNFATLRRASLLNALVSAVARFRGTAARSAGLW
jgi:hypothetical protein